MHEIHALIDNSLPAAWFALAVSFAVLAKSAGVFVDSSVSLARRFNIPKLVVGIVLVSLATTAPELSVSLMAALRGNPEMALGNAIGSVICDDGLAMGLCAVFSPVIIAITPRTFRLSVIFLVLCQAVAFLFIVGDMTLSRPEGAVLVSLFVTYIAVLFYQHKKTKDSMPDDETDARSSGERHVAVIAISFIVALGAIIIASEFIITSATTIAHSFGMPESIIALTLVALGTSIPEVATCITAARKKEGAIAVGNILGADIMNICWVAGASAIANDLSLGAREVYFMFPWMFVMVGTMLVMMRAGYCLTKMKGVVLLILYFLYLASFVLVFSGDMSAVRL